jgi:hypothetical protein
MALVVLFFYYVRLYCYFVIELRAGPFKPEYAGKLIFYLSASSGATLRPFKLAETLLETGTKGLAP